MSKVPYPKPMAKRMTVKIAKPLIRMNLLPEVSVIKALRKYPGIPLAQTKTCNTRRISSKNIFLFVE